MTVYQVAIIGLGNISIGYDIDRNDVTWTHVSAVQQHSGFQLQAGIDPDPQACHRFTDHTGVLSFTSIEEFFSVLGDSIDVIVIASPTEMHLQHYLMAREYQAKLVLMEKPLVKDVSQLSQFDQMTSDAPLLVDLFRLYQPSLNNTLASLAASGRCRVQVRYSKGLVHNGIHFITLLLKHFGTLVDNKTLDHIVSITLTGADIEMVPCIEGLDDNSMIVESPIGTLYYLAGGRVAFFIDRSHQQHPLDIEEFNHHMRYVYDACYARLSGQEDDSLTLAITGQKILSEALSHAG